ncbi:alpha-amylase family glycosyl hydrolase, partial [Staphylococcus epidermidis]|uniref:alpha-amylase family glycosyl hydrolase n=1 Tax=Staphylococcus epidermidis TaxID=1282 RepID=UPI0021B3F897
LPQQNPKFNIIFHFQHLRLSTTPHTKFHLKSYKQLLNPSQNQLQNLPSNPLFIQNHHQPPPLSTSAHHKNYSYQSPTTHPTPYFLQHPTPFIYQAQEMRITNYPF